MVSQDLNNNVKKQHCQQPCWLAPCWQLHSDVEQQHAMSQSCGVAIDSTILLSSADAHSEIPDLPPQMTDTKLQISTMLAIAFMSKIFLARAGGVVDHVKIFLSFSLITMQILAAVCGRRQVVQNIGSPQKFGGMGS